MLAILQFPIKNLLPQFSHREKIENKGGDASDERSLVVVGLIGALFALLLASTSYRRWWFNHPASSLIPSPFAKAFPPPPPPHLSLIILIYSQSRNPLQQAPKTPLPNRSTTIPPADLGRVNYFFFFNDSSNARFAGANLGTVTISYQNNGISRGDVRVA